MQITSGSVSYLRVVKDDDFGIKREAKVDLSFTVDGDEEVFVAALDAVKDTAVTKVHEMLRVKAQPATKSETAAAGPATAGTPLPATQAPAAGSAPMTDKDKLAAEALAKASKKTEEVDVTAAPKKTTKPKKAPAEAVGTGQAISTGEERKDPAQEDDLSALFGEDEKPAAPAREVTDKELNEAAQKANARLKDSKKIIALKEKYVGPMPKSLRDIPKEKREEFLKELEALA